MMMFLAEEATQGGIGSLIWSFANSPLGVAIVSGVVLWLLAFLFTKQPGWEKMFDEHRGLFFDAVRHAEKAIPDGTGGAAAKADAALKFLLKLEPSLAKKKPVDLQRGLAAAHAEEEGKSG